jgi:hypothetical protein
VTFPILTYASRQAIKYELRTLGSELTAEKAQIIENKRSRLQKLIDMFSYQADAHILHHKDADDLRILPLLQYSEFDYVDIMDDADMDADTPTHHSYSSDHSGIDGTNAEDIPILLPSSLGWDWCVQHNVKDLAKKEAKLRHAQANDAIHNMRLALGYKSALFRNEVRPANTQRTKTRAWTKVHNADTAVHQYARHYSMAREAYLQIKRAYSGGPELPQLQIKDLRIKTAILGSKEVGQRNTQLPWIWSFGTTIDKDESSMNECEIYFKSLN